MSRDSWENSSAWYDRIVGEKGHFYHEDLLLDWLLRTLGKGKIKLADFACGQGVLSRSLAKNADYLGIDISPSLINQAKKAQKHPHHRFLVHDLGLPLPLQEQDFTHVVILLALQNMQDPQGVLKTAAQILPKNGNLIAVLSHPCFRIPRQSSWGVDPQKKIQYRRIDRYMTPLEIPIQTHPSRSDSPTTWTYHHPLSAYADWLHKTGFVISRMEELSSQKKSLGKMAKMENRARAEFPLFLTIEALKHV